MHGVWIHSLHQTDTGHCFYLADCGKLPIHLVLVGKGSHLVLSIQYAINKTKLFNGFIKGDWRHEVLTQLNQALNEYSEALPAHRKCGLPA